MKSLKDSPKEDNPPSWLAPRTPILHVVVIVAFAISSFVIAGLAAATLAVVVIYRPHSVASQAAPAQGRCPFQAASQLFGEVSTGPIPRPVNIIDTPGALWPRPMFSPPSNCSASQYLAIANAVNASIPGTVGAPSMLRIGFHTGASVTAQCPFTGGVNGGWLQFPAEAANFRSAGIGDALGVLAAIKVAYPCITFADLSTFAGAIAVEIAGGPAIAWYPGRLDALAPGPISPQFSTRIPDAMFNAAGVSYFYTNVGLTIRESVIFNGGGHSIGGANPTQSGWNGVFTPYGDSWPTPTNRYFTDLVNLDWKVDNSTPTAGSRLQFTPDSNNINITTDGDGGTIIRLPSDIAFKDSSILLEWSKVYAKDAALFENDFTRTMQRYQQMGAGYGFTLDTSYLWTGFTNSTQGFGTNILPLLDTDAY